MTEYERKLGENRFKSVLALARKNKKLIQPWTRPKMAEEFFRDNPMPWLLDQDELPVVKNH
jgi:hypothetical protein